MAAAVAADDPGAAMAARWAESETVDWEEIGRGDASPPMLRALCCRPEAAAARRAARAAFRPSVDDALRFADVAVLERCLGERSDEEAARARRAMRGLSAMRVWELSGMARIEGLLRQTDRMGQLKEVEEAEARQRWMSAPEDTLRHLLAEERARLGLEHPALVQIYLLLAMQLHKNGRSELAVKELRRALAIAGRESAGAASVVTLLRGALGVVLLESGQLDEAEAHLQALRQALLAGGYPDEVLAECQANLAGLALRRGRLAEGTSGLLLRTARQIEPRTIDLVLHGRDRAYAEEFTLRLQLLDGVAAIRPVEHALTHAGPRADLLIVLLSPDLIDDEALTAHVERRRAEGLWVVPVLVRGCDWEGVPALRGLSLLPPSGWSIASWPSQDDGWLSVLRTLQRQLVERARFQLSVERSPAG